MITLKKYSSREAGNFDGTALRQICHFDIPADGIYDLANSALVIPTTIATTGAGVSSVSLKNRPVTLIKNCQLSSANAGIMEDVSDVNFLQANLDRFTQNTQDVEDNALFNGINFEDEFSNNYSSFRKLTRNGTTASEERRPELRVPLSQLFSGVGGFPQYPAMMMGRTQVRVEFQGGYNMLKEHRRYSTHALACNDVPATGGPAADVTSLTLTPDFVEVWNQDLNVGQSVTVGYTLAGGGPVETVRDISDISFDTATSKATLTFSSAVVNTALLVNAISVRATLACDNVGATADPKTTLITAGTSLRSAKEVPFWVGEKISVQFTIAPAAAATTEVTITGIAYDAATFKATITVTPAWTTSADAITLISIKEVTPTAISYEVQQPQLLLMQVNPTPSQYSSAVSKLKSGAELPYRSWNLEQDSVVNSTVEYNKSFFLEPNCANALLLGQLPAGAAGDNMDSTITNLGSFRCQLNGVDVTSQDVEVNSPLYKDRILWSITNSGLPLRRLRNSPSIVANPIPLKPESQQYQVQLKKNSVGSIEPFNLHLYKQVQRVLKISGKSIQVM